MSTVEYSANNSGGGWWLSDEAWLALEDAGWTVDWVKNQDSPYVKGDANGRWLGALATRATREGLSMAEAIAEWEQVTGEDSSALGCSCCGTPHSFSDDTGDYYSPSYPVTGDRYGQ